MNQKEIEMLVQLRKYVIDAYQALEGGIPGVQVEHATMKQVDVALTLSSIARSIEDILGENVNIK